MVTSLIIRQGKEKMKVEYYDTAEEYFKRCEELKDKNYEADNFTSKKHRYTIRIRETRE